MLSSYLRLLCTLLFCAGTAPGLRAADHALSEVRRILFLGDSITYSGELVDHFEAFLLTRFPDRKFEVINVGLPGETVAGLSEPGHGNGRFPRPALHERLDRVLAKTQPELVFACYGMNDGLYQPLNEAHFARFRDGVRLLRKKVTRSGTRIVHLTPPPFDPGPRPNGPSYDKTLEAYSQWLVAQRQHG
ncbi:MAG: GDSL-type esterase/lipase family protein, partial [Verrucomicrobiota bacterium]